MALDARALPGSLENWRGEMAKHVSSGALGTILLCWGPGLARVRRSGGRDTTDGVPVWDTHRVLHHALKLTASGVRVGPGAVLHREVRSPRQQRCCIELRPLRTELGDTCLQVPAASAGISVLRVSVPGATLHPLGVLEPVRDAKLLQALVLGRGDQAEACVSVVSISLA